MSQPVFFVDVNVPMYAAGTDHPCKEACVWIMGEVAEGRLDVAIDAEIVQEILHRFSAIRQWETGVKMAANLLDLVATVHPIAVEDVRKTIDLFEEYAPQGITARDALHASVMQNHGLTHIVSADRHYDLIGGLTRIDISTLRQARSGIARARRDSGH